MSVERTTGRALGCLLAFVTATVFTTGASAQPVPMISDAALGCGAVGTAGLLAPGSEMQQLALDTNVFPDALCNDGSPALLYFRPHVGAGNATRWVIQLQGGGVCGDAQSCADRWCHLGTGFSKRQMSSDVQPFAAINGLGILERNPPVAPLDNPVRNWNHVLIRYCSSDSWSGTARDVVLDAEGPESGLPVQYAIHFLGRRILEAALATLRHDGVSPPSYTLGGGSVALPDLDDASEVLLAGGSAGGGGVILNVDRVAAELQATSQCQGASCPLQVGALIDSLFPPELAGLGFDQTDGCLSQGACDWESYMALDGSAALWQSEPDDSCESWHLAGGTEWQCEDVTHVIRNHVTTPMFVRMGQQDSLLSADFIEKRFSVPPNIPMTLWLFAARVRDELQALANLQATAEEGASIPVAPGVFGPTCPKHETLRSNPEVFRTAILDGGVPHAMFDVFVNWVQGTAPAQLVTGPGDVQFCVGVPPAPSLPGAARVVLALLLLVLTPGLLPAWWRGRSGSSRPKRR